MHVQVCPADLNRHPRPVRPDFSRLLGASPGRTGPRPRHRTGPPPHARPRPAKQRPPPRPATRPRRERTRPRARQASRLPPPARPAPRRPLPKPSERHRADLNRRVAPVGREPHHSATVSAPSSRAHQNQRWCTTGLGDLADTRGSWTCSPTWARSLVSAPVIWRALVLRRSRPRRRPYEAARRPTACELVTGGAPYSCVLSR